MNDELLSVGARAIEIGASSLLVWVLVAKPELRKYAVVMLGAVTPLLLGYVLLWFSHALDPTANEWAKSAMWVMTFVAFVTLLLVGFAVSFLPKPRNLWARYALGFFIAPTLFALSAFTEFPI